MSDPLPSGGRGRWARPPRPFGRDAARWEAFRRHVVARIEAIRAEEGIDGRREPWQTFTPPLPARAPVDKPVRLRLGPASALPRDEHGRLRRAG